MCRSLALAFAAGLVAAPLGAYADNSVGCLLGPTDVHRCSVSGAPAAALAAIAAPVLVAGAAATVAHELGKRTDERVPDGVQPTPAAQQRPSLALVPEPPDPYRVRPGKPERAAGPNRAVQFNEAATDVGIAVTGAMVVGAIIANLAHKK
jgi:hypothetical protein